VQQPGGDQVAVEPVEGVADDGQLEVPGFRVEDQRCAICTHQRLESGDK
jgi:hypothetical protein